MALGESLVSTVEAARVLGVSVQHVRRLTDAGELTRLARGVIDRDSLERYIAERQGGRTRVWAEHTAWGAIALLSEVEAPWLGPTQASRVRAWMRTITEPGDLVTQTRNRADVQTFQAHPSALRRLRDELVTTDPSRLGLVGTQPQSRDGYLPAGRLARAIASFGLGADPGGNLTLRVTAFDIDTVRDIATRGVVLTALDAATSRDPRERGVGEQALTAALERFRR